MVGTTISHYKVLEKIGQGGMGEVYRAEDTNLSRDVAIKVLPEQFTQDPQRLARFEREAKLLASLNHPNIAAIYGFEQADDVHFLVLELVPGETLAERVAKGPLPVEEALEVCRQIAEGVEAAHEKGVIHRDLKPANVKVTPEGKVKILDFGLAKALEAEIPTADMSQSPTLTYEMTRAGVIMGTAGYMSPEQAQAKPVEKSTDIWSFGCLLYEMLTGQKAFEGDTVTEIIASVLKTDPDWDRVSAKVPRAVHKLLKSCLDRKQEGRLKTIGEARTILAESISSRGGAIVSQLITVAERSRRLWWAAAALVIVAIAFWVSSQPAVESVQPVSLTQLTANPLETSVTGAAISPDGKYLAFVDVKGLHLQLMSSGETNTLELGNDLTPLTVSWYPDSTRLLVLTKAEGAPPSLWSTSALGGEARRIQDGVMAAAISPDGTTLAFIRGASTRDKSFREIWLAGANGEKPRLFLTADPEESFWRLSWAPDSQRLAYGTWDDIISSQEPLVSIRSSRLDGNSKTVLLSGADLFQNWTGPLPFVWSPDGRLIFARQEQLNEEGDPVTSNLWAVESDITRGVITGEPRRMTQLVGSNVRGLSLSEDGQALVALMVRNQADILIGRLNSEGTLFDEEIRLTDDDWPDFPSGWSPDGEALLFSSFRSGTRDIYRMEISNRSTQPIMTGPGDQDRPVYTTDGRFILYLSDETINRIPDIGGPPEEVLSGFPFLNIECLPGAASECLAGHIDGKEYVFTSFDAVTGNAQELLRISHRAPFTKWDLSPDGSTLAVVHNDDDAVRLISLSSGQEKILRVQDWTSFEFVSWAGDGQRLFLNAGFSIAGKLSDLISVDLQGNASILRQAVSQWHVYPVTSPDGRYVAFSSMPFHGNAWLITEF